MLSLTFPTQLTVVKSICVAVSIWFQRLLSFHGAPAHLLPTLTHPLYHP